MAADYKTVLDNDSVKIFYRLDQTKTMRRIVVVPKTGGSPLAFIQGHCSGIEPVGLTDEEMEMIKDAGNQL